MSETIERGADESIGLVAGQLEDTGRETENCCVFRQDAVKVPQGG